MSEFKKVPHPSFQPRSCALCGAHEGPFADTEVDIVPYGHIYLCMSTPRRAGCVRQLAKLDEMVPKEQLDFAKDVQRTLQARIDELEARTLEVVPLKDVREEMLAGLTAKEE